MAALLAAFKSMPHVARRRAKELYDLIYTCVNEYKSTKRAEVNEPPAVAPASAVQVESMAKEPVKLVGNADALHLRLWAKGKNAFLHYSRAWQLRLYAKCTILDQQRRYHHHFLAPYLPPLTAASL